MSEIAVAVGDLAQAGLTARALEPGHGETGGHTHESACLNCATPLVGPHCHQCGQRGHVHRTLGAFFHDLLHGVLHFEGKTWRTLPMLAWRPGKLTREYIDGRRASYVSPIALFLFVVFLTFAAFHALGSPINVGKDIGGRSVVLDGTKMSLTDAEREVTRRVGELRAQRREAMIAGKPVAAIDKELTERAEDLATVRALAKGDLGAVVKSDGSVTTKSRTLEAMWRKAKANPELTIYKLQSNAYKYSWLLIPISVPFVWLLFPLRRRALYDHTVFVTYSLSFMSLLLMVAAAGAKWGVKFLTIGAVLYVPFHMYRQLRETYVIGRRGAIARTVVLLLLAGIALALWGAAILALIVGE